MLSEISYTTTIQGDINYLSLWKMSHILISLEADATDACFVMEQLEAN